MLLDLSTAFNTIDNNILLNTLENFVGICGSTLAWFKLYLSDRHQFVVVNEEVSYQSQVQYGVHQGNFLLLNSEKTEVLIIGPKTPQVIT